MFIFQFLWGWNSTSPHGKGQIELARRLDSLSVPFRMKRWYIRWGVWRWDILSISLRTKLHSAKERNGAHSDFQFLWGWNGKGQALAGVRQYPLSIPLRMKHVYIPLSAFSGVFPLSIPLRMKPRGMNAMAIPEHCTFNSFEDETSFQMNYQR